MGAALYVLLPVLAQTFGLNLAQVGLIRATKSAAMMLFELPSGLLAERLGERPLLVFGMAVAGAGFLVLAIADRYEIILVALAIAGLGAAFQHSLSSAVISAVFPAGIRRTALGAYNSAGDVGKLVLSSLFAATVGVGIAWQATVSLFGLLGLGLAAIAFFAIPPVTASAKTLAAELGQQGERGQGWGVRSKSAVVALTAVVFADIAVQSGFLTFVAFLMSEREPLPSMAGLAVVLVLAGGILGKFACGYLADRLGPRKALILAQCLTTAGLVGIIAAPNVLTLALLPLLGTVLQGSSTITYGSVSDLFTGARQSRGFGMIYTVSNLASVFGPVFFGLVANRYGLEASIWAMAVLIAATIPLYGMVFPRGTKPKERASG